MKALALLALAAALGAGVTWVALESGEVAIVHTLSPAGWPRQAKVWVIDADGFTWIAASSPTRDWYQDLRLRPRVKLERGGSLESFEAEVRDDEASSEYVRRMMERKYGWAVGWIGLFRDPEEMVAIRLHPR